MFVPKTKPDMYSQEHPIENEELSQAKLDKLDQDLEKLDAKEKAAYLQALEKCPQLITPKDKLQVLRCEVFNADVSTSTRTGPHGYLPLGRSEYPFLGFSVTPKTSSASVAS